MTPLEEVCGLFLPKDTLTYFDITHVESTDDEVRITLTEKDLPPKEYKQKTCTPKGFKTIIVSDFPIRGKRGILTFNRRYWKVEGMDEYVTNDLPLVAPGTKLERDFAEILKKRGGDDPDFLGEYSSFIPHTP
jgi:hypothetical protein